MAFIRYIIKNNGNEYASLLETNRKGGCVKQKYIKNLGRVIDKENGIFQNRENGIFRYTLENGYIDLPAIYKEKTKKERLILDFGDSFFLYQYIRNQIFNDAFYKILPEHTDSLLSLIFYKILTDKKAYCYADMWWQGNYVSILFPNAKLTSQRISELLVIIGSEDIQRKFFIEYYRLIYGTQNVTGILIDSSGLPNSTKMSVTQISNHNGDINLEARLIYVIDRKSGMPIYFRYCAGNIIDVTTLCTTLAELRHYHIDIDYAVLDAGYYSEVNIKELYQNNIKFITRLAPNRTLFKEVVAKCLPDLLTSTNVIRYGNRLLYVRKMPILLCDYVGFAYVGIDMDSRNQQMKKTIFAALDDKLSKDDIDNKIAKLGVFVIVSSEDVKTEEILPLYYTRQQIEQVFDVGKNNADLLPLRVQNENTFRGHLMITFLATIILQKLQRDIITKSNKKDKINPEGAFISLRNQKCKVYEDEIVPQEAVKSINDVYKLFKIIVPISLCKNCSEN